MSTREAGTQKLFPDAVVKMSSIERYWDFFLPATTDNLLLLSPGSGSRQAFEHMGECGKFPGVATPGTMRNA
jgi:hypothetical protein